MNPQTPRRPLMPPLSAPDRSSKNIAEPVRLRSLRASPFRKSLRGVLQNRILMGAGDCGGRLRARYRKTGYGLFFATVFQITDRPRKMRQYRLNRESLLYMKGEDLRTLRGHRESCRDEFETHSYYPFRSSGNGARSAKKMKPQPRFKALAGIFYRGFYAGISRRLLVFQSICGERRFASCRVRKKVKRSAHNPYSGLFGNSRQTRVSNLAIAPNMQLRTFGKILNPAFQIDRPQTPIFSFLSPFKTV